MSKNSVSAPPLGLGFIDEEGVHWIVRNLIQNPKLDGFFLLRQDHGPTPECNDGSMVLAHMEWEALIRSRGLKATAPDLANAVPLIGPAASPKTVIDAAASRSVS